MPFLSNFFLRQIEKGQYLPLTVDLQVLKFLLKLSRMSSYISNFDLSERLCHFLTLGAWKLGYCEAIQENEQYWSDKFKQIDTNLLHFDPLRVLTSSFLQFLTSFQYVSRLQAERNEQAAVIYCFLWLIGSKFVQKRSKIDPTTLQLRVSSMNTSQN